MNAGEGETCAAGSVLGTAIFPCNFEPIPGTVPIAVPRIVATIATDRKAAARLEKFI